MSLENKTILLLIDQKDYANVIEIAYRLKNKVNIVFFITDIYTNYDIYRNAFKILKKKFPHDRIYDLRDELVELNNTKFFEDINLKKIKDFENRINSNLIIQNFLKDINLNNIYGHRDITYHPSKKNVYYKFIELILDKIFYIIDNNKFTHIYAPTESNFVKNIILDYAIKNHIDYFKINHRIFDHLHLISLSDQTNTKIMNKVDNHINKKLFKKYKNILFQSAEIIEDKKKIIGIKKFIKIFFKQIIFYCSIFKNEILTLKKFQINPHHKNYFYPKSFFYSCFYWLNKTINAYRVEKYCLQNNKEKLKIINNKKFIFYPLHVTPETGVYDQSELYDQLYLIQKIAKKLPVDYFLVVKTHPANFSISNEIENLKWYKKINKIYNVILINHHINSKYLINKCEAVVSVSGSANLEANLMGKPSFIMGNTEYSGLYGIYKFNDQFLKNIKDFDKSQIDQNQFFYNYIFNESVRYKSYAKFLCPSKEDLQEIELKKAFDFFANKILKEMY